MNTKKTAKKTGAPKTEASKTGAPKTEASKIVKCEYHAGAAIVREGKAQNKHVITGHVIRVKYETAGIVGEWINAAADAYLTYKGYGKVYKDKLAANKARLEVCAENGINWATRDAEYAKVCAELKAKEAERAKARKDAAQKIVDKGEREYMRKGKELRAESWKRVCERANG